MTDATLLGLPLLYLIGPLLLFGPILLFVAYSLGLGGLFKRSNGAAAESETAIERKRARKNRRIRETAWFLGGGVIRKKGPMAFVAQAGLFAAFAVFIATFSSWPSYRIMGPDEAVIKMTMSYPAARKIACRQRTREELQKLPPNMRAPKQCSRQRWPAEVMLWLDGAVIYERIVTPSGLSDDGPSIFYQRFTIRAGRHLIKARVRDAGGTRAAHELERSINIEKGSVVVVGFDENAKKIILR